MLIVLSVMKGKYKLALFGAFIPLCALVAAIRLARPESRWAKRHYGPEKLARAPGEDRVVRRTLRSRDRMGERLRGGEAIRTGSGPVATSGSRGSGFAMMPSDSGQRGTR